jgi:uncharacterized protein
VSETVRVLAIDGGGIRGIVPALVLAELERRSERRVSELFDLVAGTSTGGILGCALTLPGDDGAPRFRAEEMLELYEREGPRIFRRSPWRTIRTVGGLADERYPSGPLEDALETYFGDALLSSALVDTMVTAYELERREVYVIKSWQAEKGEIRTRDAVHATSAAPTYFEPVAVEHDGRRRSLVDGGVFAANPAMCAYAEAVRRRPGREVVVVSLGTGQLIRPIEHAEATGWGLVEWVRPLIDVIFDGAADAVDYQLEHVLGEGYFRLQTRLDMGARDDMDDASQGNLRALRKVAERLIRDADRELDAIVERVAP